MAALKLIILAVIIIGFAILGMAIKILFIKGGTFSGGSCNSDPTDVNNGGESCSCGSYNSCIPDTEKINTPRR